MRRSNYTALMTLFMVLASCFAFGQANDSEPSAYVFGAKIRVLDIYICRMPDPSGSNIGSFANAVLAEIVNLDFLTPAHYNCPPLPDMVNSAAPALSTCQPALKLKNLPPSDGTCHTPEHSDCPPPPEMLYCYKYLQSNAKQVFLMVDMSNEMSAKLLELYHDKNHNISEMTLEAHIRVERRQNKFETGLQAYSYLTFLTDFEEPLKN